MEIDTRFPTKLDAVSDAPEPLRSALVKSFPSGEPVRLLVHAPAFSTVDEKSPATVLAVTNNGWLVASATEDGGAAVEKSDFRDTLFLELTSVLLLGQLRVYFATVITERELVLISEEKKSPRQFHADEFGGIITFFPRVRLADFHVRHHERFCVLALQVHATYGGEKLEIIFPSDDEMAVSKAMEQVLRSSAT